MKGSKFEIYLILMEVKTKLERIIFKVLASVVNLSKISSLLHDCIFLNLHTVDVMFTIFDSFCLSESELCQVFVLDVYVISTTHRPIVVELIFRICV